VTPRYRDLKLTEAGLKVIHPGDKDDEAFVVTAVTCDQLYKRGSSYALLSTAELMDRIHSPAFGPETVHRLIVHLHGRFMQPLLNIITVLLIIPLMVRRESTGLVMDSALCSVVLGVFFGAVYGAAYLGQAHLVAPDQAAWIPVVVGGSMSAWYSGVVRT
jgi:lipopolysaccharide export system permease protein